jgi:hypothetical protein
MAGSRLMVQHWTEETAERQHCRLVSLSDMFIQQQRSEMQLAWDMTVKPLSESSCEFTNSIFLFETDALLAFFENGDAPPEQVRDALQRALDAHNEEETPAHTSLIRRQAQRVARSSSPLLSPCRSRLAGCVCRAVIPVPPLSSSITSSRIPTISTGWSRRYSCRGRLAGLHRSRT